MNNEKYNKLIEKISLDKIELNSLNCAQNENFNEKGNLDIVLNHDIINTIVHGVELSTLISFKILAVNNNEIEIENNKSLNKDSILFKIEFILNLEYSLQIESEEDFLVDYKKEIETFVENNVPFNAWPYAREIVSSITTRMGFPALIMPTYKLIPKY
ncbi:protein-export chaperone SecB [Ureibacillus massiliensis]|uniref:protein-export chaperone SecB n=1 Tax=Ureibacillus massiliensis TaxID=292806 RepID=UPI0006918EDA|nr:protein-export chaperone SecB [Ureibacillus massiliensis]